MAIVIVIAINIILTAAIVIILIMIIVIKMKMTVIRVTKVAFIVKDSKTNNNNRKNNYNNISGTALLPSQDLLNPNPKPKLTLLSCSTNRTCTVQAWLQGLKPRPTSSPRFRV